MSNFPRVSPRAALILAWLSSMAPIACAQEDLPKLLEHLANGPTDQSVLFQIEAQPTDPKITAALESAFARRQSKEEKQWIAVTLVRLRDANPSYFQFLAGYAREAIEDRAPFFMKFDAEGHSIKGQMDPSFESWCASNGKNPRAVGGIQAGTYPVDVL